jgi:hypothetical protein
MWASAKSATDDSFWFRHSGNIGQEILAPDGRVVAWTTDEEMASRICKLLNEASEDVDAP